MTDVFASPKAKIRRAHEHLDSLKAEVTRYVDSEPWTITHKAEEGGRHHVFCVQIAREPPEDIALISGDAIHNLRGALDHMVYAIALDKQPALTLKEQGRLQFPISVDIAAFNEQVNRGRLFGVPDIAAVEGMQPYHHGQIPDALAILRDLSNVDKHRRLALLLVAIEQGWVGSIPREDTIWNRDALVDGAEVVRLIFATPEKDMDVHIGGTRFTVAIEELPAGSPKPFASVDTIELLVNVVETVVLPDFEQMV